VVRNISAAHSTVTVTSSPIVKVSPTRLVNISIFELLASTNSDEPLMKKTGTGGNGT
jgi:hypothetical protein